MIGWVADFFRIAWGLFYWNIRKSWFQMRKGHAPRCPCQNPSDSGRALETACEACIGWQAPRRFRHVCPLLVETQEGLRCSANASEVRPFWPRAFGYYGASLASVYLGGALTFFTFLRLIGYPVNIFHTLWPPAWHHLREVRGDFFLNKANQAFAARRTSEGLLYLSNAYEFDPGNYTAGLLFAKNIQLGQPNYSDSIYQRLLHEHPEQRAVTAQEWFRVLLARGDYPTIQRLAREFVVEDVPHSSVWMRALLFATRQTKSDAPLRELMASSQPAAKVWRPLLEIEFLAKADRPDDVRTALAQTWSGMPAYSVYYQIETLIDLGESFKALDLLDQYGRRIDDEARVTLQLEAYAQLGARRLLQRQTDLLLGPPPNYPTLKILAAHLIRHPDQALLDQVYAQFVRANFPINSDSAGIYLSLYCAAGVAQDWSKVHAIGGILRRSTGSSFVMLGLMESFFRGDAAETRISAFLPAVPLPLEVIYALLERFPGGSRPALILPKL